MADPLPPGVFARTVRRIIRLDFQRERATDHERALLAGGRTPIRAPIAQDYAAWRRSLLYVSALAALLHAVFQLIGFNPLADGLPASAVRAIGPRNLALVDDVARIVLVVLFVGTLLVTLAALAWRN